MKFDESTSQLVETDKCVTEVLCLLAKSDGLKKKEKVRMMGGTTLDCYYKIKGKAAKMYKSVKKINTKAKSIVGRTRKGISKTKSVKGKIKKVKNTKGKSLL